LDLAELAQRFLLPGRRICGAPKARGSLVERALGASAGSRAVLTSPSFDRAEDAAGRSHGRAVESTFVCTIPLTEIGQVEWADSRVKRKLTTVLWVPVEGEREIPVGQRRMGRRCCTPHRRRRSAAARDWEELAGFLAVGTSSLDRPRGAFCDQAEAAHSRARRVGFDADGRRLRRCPRASTAPSFTRALLQRHFACRAKLGRHVHRQQPEAASKAAVYAELNQQLASLLVDETDGLANAANWRRLFTRSYRAQLGRLLFPA